MEHDVVSCSVVMNAISIKFTDLSSSALIAIFQIADILKVTPTRAAELWLAERDQAENQKEVA